MALPSDPIWSSRTGATDRAIYSTLIHLASLGGSTEVSASIRQLAVAANVSSCAVTAALRRLGERRLVERVVTPACGMAYRYRLTEGAVSAPPARASTTLDDLFTNGFGLGLSCRETWEALTREPTKVKELATKRPGQLQVATIRAHLRELENCGLAARNGHRWWRVEPDDETLQRLTSMLGVRGRSEARAEHYARQVQRYRERFPGNLSAPRAHALASVS